MWMNPYGISWESAITRAPLNRRGWVIQERARSTRILHWSSVGVFWECNELKASEGYPEGIIDKRVELVYHADALSRSDEFKKHKDPLMDAWCRFAENVCSSEFTYLTDRLAAISGMVKKTQEQVEERHFAGMWQGAMNELLTWTTWAASPPDPSKTHGYVAPSWCWISSTAGGVDINRRLEKNKRFLSTIIEVKVIPPGLDPTGPVTEGSRVRLSVWQKLQRHRRGIGLAAFGERVCQYVCCSGAALLPPELDVHSFFQRAGVQS